MTRYIKTVLSTGIYPTGKISVHDTVIYEFNVNRPERGSCILIFKRESLQDRYLFIKDVT